MQPVVLRRVRARLNWSIVAGGCSYRAPGPFLEYQCRVMIPSAGFIGAPYNTSGVMDDVGSVK
jgi:hypothetical protein